MSDELNKRSSAATAKANAALEVFGRPGQPLLPCQEILGVNSDDEHRAGELPEWGGRPWSEDRWSLRETEEVAPGQDYSAAVEGCLSRLLQRLADIHASEKLKTAGLLREARLSLYGPYCSPNDTNLRLGPDTLRLLADLGVALDEDFYFIGGGSEW